MPYQTLIASVLHKYVTHQPGSSAWGCPADEFRRQTGPARLVGRTQSRTTVSMKILVEQKMILPVRVRLKELDLSEHGPPSVLPGRKDTEQSSVIGLPDPAGHSTRKSSPSQAWNRRSDSMMR